MAQVTVSVLFTDLVGSTELLSRVGADRAEELRVEHFAALRSAIGPGGREVKNLGDGLMVVFDSALAALAASVAMQQSIEARNRGQADELAVRMGLSSGEADVAEGDYFGVPVVEAARLCAAAGGGEVLAAGLVRALAGSRGGFAFESVGELSLKGLTDPVETWRVLWSPAELEAVPLQARVRMAGDATFVGRDTERDKLVGALVGAQGAKRQVLLIGGEPGVGKTSLATSFARDAFDQGAWVLYGRSDEDLGVPYQPWVEAIDHLVRHAPLDVLEAHAAARPGELAGLAPSLATRLGSTTTRGGPVERSDDGQAERYLLFGAVVDLLTRAGEQAPVVLILDDLHWADRQSLQLLRHVCGADASLRLVVLATFRDSEIGADHPLADLLAGLHREPNVERLALRGLDRRELLDLMEATAGHSLDDDGLALRDALMAETEGNPFFAGEILRHLAETGAIYLDESGRWTSAPGLDASSLPVSVRAVVSRRIARLGGEAQQVLSMAAVIGRDFDLALLSRVVEVDEDRLVDLLDHATRAAVIAEAGPAGSFTFAHALIAHTLYDEQSALRRARAHQAIGEALEELCRDRPGERVGELAFHWAQATQPQDLSKAITYARQAGDRALASQAPDEAARWYREALDHLDRQADPDPRLGAELLVGVGEAQRQAGDPAHRQTLLEAATVADRVGQPQLVARAALANNRGWASATGEVDAERVAVLTRALEVVGDDPQIRARLLATLCAEQLFGLDFADRLALADEAEALARSVGDDRTLLDVLVRTHESIVAPQTLERRLALTDEACRLSEQLGDPLLHMWAHIYRYLAALECGQTDEMDRALAIAQAAADHLGQPTSRWTLAVVTAMDSQARGPVAEAEARATEALQIGMDAGQPDAVGAYGMQLITVRFMQGRMAEMVPLLEQTAEAFARVAATRSGLALGYTETGDLEAAGRMLDAEAATGFDRGIGSGWLSSHAMWALVAFRTGRRDVAQPLFDLLSPYADQYISSHVTIYGAVAYPVGLMAQLLGRHDEADELYRRATDIDRRLGSQFYVALAGLTRAELAADPDATGRHDPDEARRLAASALAAARQGGFVGVERAAEALADRLG